MHPCKLLQSLLFPSAHCSQECLLQKYLTLAGTMHSSLFFFSFFFYFPFPLECSVFIYRKAVRVKSKKSLSHYKVNRSPNTAEYHQSQLSHTQDENGSLQRALDLLEACLYSTRFWETFREKLSCIAWWKATRTQIVDAKRHCCVPQMKLHLSWPDNSFKNRLQTIRSCGAFCSTDETLNHFSRKD